MGLIVALLLAGGAARATDFDFLDREFTWDSDVALIDFTVAEDSDVTLFTSSWLRGDPPAGFDPVLGLWGADGALIEFQDDGRIEGTTLSNGVSYAHGLWDAYLHVVVTAGDYTASLSQYDNCPANNPDCLNTPPVPLYLSDGFKYGAEINFTEQWGDGDSFNGKWDSDDQRHSNWEFHILVAPVQTVPEPSTWLLLGFGGVTIARLRRRRP